MKNTNYYIIGAIVLLGGFLAYKKGLFGKKDDSQLDDTDDIDDVGKNTPKQQIAQDLYKLGKEIVVAKSLQNKDSYKSKVAEIQTILGVTPDGIVGKNTLMALQNKYGLLKGNLSPKNINYYYELVTNKATKTKRKMVKQSSQNSATIKQSVEKGGTLQMLQSEDSQALRFDVQKNKFFPIVGKRYKFAKDEKLSLFKIYSIKNNSVFVQNKLNSQIFEIPSKKLIVI